MKKIKVLMVFDQRHSIMKTISKNLQLFDIDVKCVHSLQEGLDLESDFDLLFTDICFPLSGNEVILAPNEQVEHFLNTQYIVFNFLKKTQRKVLLFDSYSHSVVQDKLEQMGLLSKVQYCTGCLVKDDILPTIQKLVKQNSAGGFCFLLF